VNGFFFWCVVLDDGGGDVRGRTSSVRRPARGALMTVISVDRKLQGDIRDRYNGASAYL
jgi:hypothetical protein